MDVSKLGALFPKPVAAPSNGQSLGQVYKHIAGVKSKKKLSCPIAFGLGQESLPIPRAQFFLADGSKRGPLFKKFGCKFCKLQRAEIVLKGGFRVISGPWNIP